MTNRKDVWRKLNDVRVRMVQKRRAAWRINLVSAICALMKGAEHDYY